MYSPSDQTLRETFQKFSDEELLEIIQVKCDDYTEKALLIAKEVVSERGGIAKLKKNSEKFRQKIESSEKVVLESGGIRVTLQAYLDDSGWRLEILDEYQNSFLWGNDFDSAHAALEAGKRAIAERGIQFFVRRPKIDSETPRTKARSGWLRGLLGKSKEGKSLYWGPTKLDILCISIQVFDRQYLDALDTDIMMNVIDQIIPDIKNCRPKDIRLSHATKQEMAFTNASRLLNETALSEGALIYGEMGFSLDGIAVYFALSIIAGGGKKKLVTIMKKSTHWSENLKVR